MPSHPCRWPTCTVYLPYRGYCPEHEAAGDRDRRERDRYYDQHQRDPEAKAFYNSAAWQRARGTKLATNPVCERCGRVFAEHVHHRKPLKDCSDAERVDQANLMSLCLPCHNAVEAEAARTAGAT